MKWGLLARTETDRGLGIQTLAMYNNLHPDATLIIDVPTSGFPGRIENYGNETWKVTLNAEGPGLPEDVVRDWWTGLDVVVTVETFYDWRLIEWAKADGVRTVVHCNPEFWMKTNPQPDVWWYPTPWRIDKLPPGVLLPVPVEERPVTALPADEGAFKIMHVAGNAMEDRNGTHTVINAMRQIRHGIDLTLYHQTAIPRAQHPAISVIKNVPDRWDMYADHHALVLPRRYGGLCLPVQEAMACGLAVFMTDCSPNLNWPVVPLSSDLSKTVRMQTGPVETYEASPPLLANLLKHYANNRKGLAEHQAHSRCWANLNRWSVLKEMYYAELDLARR